MARFFFALLLALAATRVGVRAASDLSAASRVDSPETWEAPGELIPVRIREYGCSLAEDDRQFLLETIAKLAAFYHPENPDRQKAFLVIELYGSQECYEAALTNMGIRAPRRTTSFGTPAESPAMYIPRLQRAVIPKFGWEIASIFHELAHHVHRWAMARTEIWLNEGFSTYFEDMFPGAEGIQVSSPSVKERILRRIFEFRLLEIPTLLAMDHRAFNTGGTEQVLYRYYLSWAIVGHLYEKHPEILRELMQRVNRGEASSPVLETRYPEGLKGLRDDLEARYNPRD